MVEPDANRAGGNRRRFSGGAIGAMVGGALLLIFVIQNTEKIRLHFLAWHFSWPLWLYTLVVAAFGALFWVGLGIMRRHRRRRDRRAYRRGE